MKTRMCVVMAAVVVLAMGVYHQVGADAAAGAAKIALVDVTKVLESCNKHQAWKEKMEKDQDVAKKEFEDMRSELQQLQDNIKLRKVGSDDHIKLTQQFVEKKAILEAKNSFYEEKVTAQMQNWTEELYKELMVVVDKVAQQKGVDLVLTKDQLDLPAPSLRDFMLTIKTKKVLFNNPKLDITEEVLAGMNSQK